MVPIRCLLPVLLLGCLSCTGRAQSPAETGPQPTLPAPQERWIPTVNIAPAVGWPDGGTAEKNSGNKKAKRSAVLVVGHQPTLGQTAALLLSGSEAPWTIKKGALWWFTNRTRLGETQTVLRSVMAADLSTT